MMETFLQTRCEFKSLEFVKKSKFAGLWKLCLRCNFVVAEMKTDKLRTTCRTSETNRYQKFNFKNTSIKKQKIIFTRGLKLASLVLGSQWAHQNQGFLRSNMDRRSFNFNCIKKDRRKVLKIQPEHKRRWNYKSKHCP